MTDYREKQEQWKRERDDGAWFIALVVMIVFAGLWQVMR